jgi:catechol 2,3-dioxygenase-like lactoylglutathione lyase family enzyme
MWPARSGGTRRCSASAAPTRRRGGDFPAVLEANGSGVALFPLDEGDPPPPPDPLRHVAFRTSRQGLDAAKAELRVRGVEFEERNYGVAWSIYMPDPDGLLVEITTYEVTRG